MSIISGVCVCAVGLTLIALGQHFAVALAVSLGTATLVGGCWSCSSRPSTTDDDAEKYRPPPKITLN